MCYYDNNETNGGEEISVASVLHSKVTIEQSSNTILHINENQVLGITLPVEEEINHDNLLGLNSGNYQHLTPTEKEEVSHINRDALDLVSNTNTGDETQQTIKDKLGPADTDSDGYIKNED
jgi:hypothetical protein